MFNINSVINLITSNKLLLRYLIIIFVLSLSNIILTNIKNNNEVEFMQINDKYNKIKQLNNDEFVKKHLFIENENNIKNFVEYVKKYLIKNYGKVIDIKTINSKNIYNIKVETIEFNLTFAHDKFIFELLKLIQDYSPGFVRITDIYIKKNKIFDINVNNLNAKIVCDIYTK